MVTMETAGPHTVATIIHNRMSIIAVRSTMVHQLMYGMDTTQMLGALPLATTMGRVMPTPLSQTMAIQLTRLTLLQHMPLGPTVIPRLPCMPTPTHKRGVITLPTVMVTHTAATITVGKFLL